MVTTNLFPGNLARSCKISHLIMNRFNRNYLAVQALAVALLFPSWALAANLGPLSVQSGRNEPLRAEIMVVGVNPAEAESLTAVLASRQAHEEARVPYSAATQAVVVTLEPRGPDTMTVVLRTREPVEDPSIAVLIELRSKLTQDTRPYRIDTTGIGRGVAPVVTTAQTSNARAEEITPKNPNLSESSQARGVTPAPRKAPTASNRDDLPSSAAVVEGDTLARIAARVKADDISLDRAMLAIFRANPGAFFGSIHQLKANRTLAVPSRDNMLSSTEAFIASELRRHSEIFQAYKSRIAAAPTLANTAPSAQGPREGSTGSTAKYDRLVLSRSPGAGLNSDEKQTAIDNALMEANSRIAELERNLSDLGRLAELKDRQLAQTAANLKRLNSEAASIAATAAAPAAPSPITNVPAAAPATTPATAAPVATAPVATNPAATTPVATTPAAASAPASPIVTNAKPPVEAAAAAAASAMAAKADTPAPVIAKSSEPEESPWWNYGLYGGIAVIALLIGWLYRRYKRSKDPQANFDRMVAQHSMFNTQTDWDSTRLEVDDQKKKPKPKAASSEGPHTLRAEA